MEYGIVTDTSAVIFQEAKEARDKAGERFSTIADEALQGFGVIVTGRSENGYMPVVTHYGYNGFMRQTDLRLVSLSGLKEWEESPLAVVSGAWVDVMESPRVQGVRIQSLCRGALVELMGLDRESGWAKIRMADGRCGYMRSQYVSPKRFSQSGLWEEELPQAEVEETHFRRQVVKTALSYLGVQYRWGGKTPLGIDCSGLASMCYMINGVLIYRDARLEAGYPVLEISGRNKKPGDLLYFPGHIAVYMGDGKYIHSTGKAGDGKVTVSSLEPGDDGYRRDLAESLYAVGSIFEEPQGRGKL